MINTTLTLTEPRTREAKQSAKHTIQHDRRRRRGGGDFCAQTRRRYVRGSHAHTLTRAAAAQRDKYDSHTACCYGPFVCTLALTGNSINILAYGREALCWASTALQEVGLNEKYCESPLATSRGRVAHFLFPDESTLRTLRS